MNSQKSDSTGFPKHEKPPTMRCTSSTWKTVLSPLNIEQHAISTRPYSLSSSPKKKRTNWKTFISNLDPVGIETTRQQLENKGIWWLGSVGLVSQHSSNSHTPANNERLHSQSYRPAVGRSDWPMWDCCVRKSCPNIKAPNGELVNRFIHGPTEGKTFRMV